MLELLHIENIAIIEAADIEFAPGFNALTGETGAGKSIVIDSLSAVLGQRTSRELIRTGAEKAFVSAAFSGMAPELTEELGIQPEADGTLLLQREIQTDGKNVCRVNGRPVTVGQLRALGARLLNIHGQHDGQQLLDEEQHIVYLDSFGRVESLAITYAEKYKNFTLSHGECVALGCVAAAFISWKHELLTMEEYYEVRDMFVPFNLPISVEDIDPQEVLRLTKSDKKMKDGTLQFILLKRVGKAMRDTSVTDEDILAALDELTFKDED